MVMTHGGARGSWSGSFSGFGAKLIDKGLREFIASEVTRGILNATLVMFGSIKEGIIELIEDRLRIFRVNLATNQSRERILSFKC